MKKLLTIITILLFQQATAQKIVLSTDQERQIDSKISVVNKTFNTANQVQDKTIATQGNTIKLLVADSAKQAKKIAGLEKLINTTLQPAVTKAQNDATTAGKEAAKATAEAGKKDIFKLDGNIIMQKIGDTTLLSINPAVLKRIEDLQNIVRDLQNAEVIFKLRPATKKRK